MAHTGNILTFFLLAFLYVETVSSRSILLALVATFSPPLSSLFLPPLSGMDPVREPPEPWSSQANSEEEKQRELESRRAQARERMAKRRAAIKNLPPEVQKELTEKARASRAKYRAQHRALLMQKEQSRRMRVFTEKHGWDEYIKRKRVRQSKSQSPPEQPTHDYGGAA
ncbi:hypothetical protein B0H11DRAFT_2099924, partial [Mycena galericulata]